MPNRSKSSISPARLAAFDILSRVESESSYASTLLANLKGLSPEDRALAREITLGTLRRLNTLDYFIERHSTRPLRNLDTPVIIALRIGLYQIRYLDRIPTSAAVNESVNLVKQARVTSASGLVNAVLRKAATNISDEPGSEIADSELRESIALSHPQWMLQRWKLSFGANEVLALAESNNAAAPLAFRVNQLKTSEADLISNLKSQGLQTKPSDLVAGGYLLIGGSERVLIEAAAEGLVYIQDEASQLISALLNPQPGERILDLCAAPGSKSTHIAALTENQSQIVACDLRRHRLSTLNQTARRLGVSSIETVSLDATKDLAFVTETMFDRVLIDAPCSGTGTLRRHPEIKWRLKPADIETMASIQMELLKNGSRAVRDGGILIYSTCSLEPEENEAVVKAFLEQAREFSIVRPSTRSELIIEEGFIRTYPHRHGVDGFFAAILTKSRQ